MNKRILSLLLALAMVVGMTVPAVYAEETENQTPAQVGSAKAEAANAIDFTNGNVAECPACGKEVTWTATAGNDDGIIYATAEGGHYYLTGDVAATTDVSPLFVNKNVCVHLNGHNLDATGGEIALAAITVKSTGSLNLFGDGTITGDATSEGLFLEAGATANIYGGNFETGAKTLIAMSTDATVNMYAGTLDGKNIAVTNAPGVLHMNNEGAEFNMYGGTIQNGKTTGNGGNIKIEKGVFNMYGGLITGGVSTADAANNVGGGNAWVQGGTARMNVYAGTISEGEAKANGGNVLVGYGAILTLDSGAVVSGGESKRTSDDGLGGGGNVYVYATGQLVTKAGSQIYGGTATLNGFEIAAITGTTNVSATVEIGGTVGSVEKNTQSRAIYLQTGGSNPQAVVTVNGGTIYGQIDSVRSKIIFNDGVLDGSFSLRSSNPSPTATINHGTFSFNPTTYVSGAEVYAGENNTWYVHQPVAKDATDATCTKPGLIRHNGCAVCDLVWDNNEWKTRDEANIEDPDKPAHGRTSVDGTPSSCTAAGNKAYYDCDCDLFYEDAAATTLIGDADALAAWKTTGDGALPKLDHAYVYEYVSATEHTGACEVCHEPSPNNTHDLTTAACELCKMGKISGEILRVRDAQHFANTTWSDEPYQMVPVAATNMVSNDNNFALVWYNAEGKTLLTSQNINGYGSYIPVFLTENPNNDWTTTFGEGWSESGENIPTKMVLYVDGVVVDTYGPVSETGTIFLDDASLKAYLQMSGSGHEHSLNTGVDSATCTEPGELAQTCEVCDATVKTPTQAKGHNYDAETGICSGCGNTACENGEHTWTYVAAKAATCVATGHEEHYTCTCGIYAQDEGEEKIITDWADIKIEKDMDNHAGESVLDPETVVQATCSAGGYSGDKVCSECGEVTEQGEATDPAPHAWIAKEANAATCVATGNIAYFNCDNCDKYAVGEEKTITEWEAIATEEDMTNHAGDSVLDPETVVEATCTAGGYTGDKVCSECGEVTEQGEATDPAPHNYEYIDNDDGTHSGVCTNNNEHTIDNEKHIFVDGVCNMCEAKEFVAATVNGTTYTTVEAALEAAVSGDQVVIFGSYAVEGTKTWDMTGITVTFEDAPEENYSLVIKGDLTIEGGKFVFQGTYGMGVTGKLTVKGGEFVGENKNDYVLGNWGTTVIEDGEFTGIYNCVNNFAGTTTIKGGSFTTEATDWTGDYESEDILADSGMTVSGGTFSKPVAEEYCAEGYIPTQNGDSYGVKVDDSQAKFNGQSYNNLEDALKAAKDNGGGIVYLNKDVEVAELTVPNRVTLDLNGKKLIMTGTTDYISAYYADSFIIDSSVAKTGRVVAEIDRLYLNDENGYLPVKMSDGIMFVQAAPGQVKKADKDYQCWIADGADNALIDALKSGKTASELGLSFQVILTWGEGSNALKYTFRDTTVAQYMEDWQGNAMYLRVTGGESVTDLKYQSRIVFADGTDAEVVLWASNPVG